MTLSLTQTFRSNQNSMNGTDPRWDKENVHFIRMYRSVHENRLLRGFLQDFLASVKWIQTKSSSDPSHFIFEINVGKRRIRYTTTLKLNDEFLDRLKID